MKGLFGMFGKKAEAPAEPAPTGPTPSPYFSPFPLTGDVVEKDNRIYTCASKTDSFMFRQIADDISGFTLRYDNNGILVWDRKVPGEAMALIKVFSTFDCAPEEMWNMLHDPVYRAVWDSARVDTYRITLLNETNDIGYYAGKSPTGIANRDFVNQRAWHNAGNGEYVIFNTSVLHYKVPEQKGFVRAISKLSGYLVRKHGESGCSLTYLTQTDPKGWLPTSVVNYVTTKFGPSMMGRMREAARAYPQWRAEQGEAWFMDWETPEAPWEVPVEDKTHDYVRKRREQGLGVVGGPYVAPATPGEGEDEGAAIGDGFVEQSPDSTAEDTSESSASTAASPSLAPM